MISAIRAKSMAKALRQSLAEKNIDLNHSACLEIVARQFGMPDWNTLAAIKADAPSVQPSIVVQHRREQEAVDFYRKVFGATVTDTVEVRGELASVGLKFGDVAIRVLGANPNREADPSRGGPFFPKANGSVTSCFHVEVADVQALLKRAIAFGATVRDALQRGDRNRLAACFFDPFGHVWSVWER